MPFYHVNRNAQSNGDHEVHENGCGHQPNAENRLTLGYHPDCRGAVEAAKKTYPQSDGCYHCCKPCHTG